jgi:hypothetical protein
MGDITYDVRVDWNDDGDFSDTGENITARTLDRSSIKLQYGRDQGRALSPIAPGQASIEVNNRSHDYSPDNVSSPLYGNLLPGRQLRIQATHNAVTYNLFNGSLEDYDVDPGRSVQSVKFTAVDAIGELAGTTLSTALYSAIRTGAALNVILDEVGWTAGRDIDLGCSVLPWWWEEGTNALDAVKNILKAEGLSAIAFLGANGEFVFRDRSARLTRTESVNVQATFTSTTEPAIDTAIQYDVGWREIYNVVTCSAEEKILDGSLSTIYQDGAIRQLSAGETVLVNASSTEPFVEAVTPVAGTDYILRSGAITVSLSRTTGQSTVISITASTAAQIEGLAVRAIKLVTLRTVAVQATDEASILKYRKRTLTYDAKFISINDARAVVDTVIASRKDRLPQVTIKLLNKNDTRILQMLGRDLSDRNHITIPEANINADFFIERIEHTINVDRQETRFGCEKVLTVPTGVFALDDSLLGSANVGAVGSVGPAEIFILDNATNGVIGVNLIGY